MSDPFLGEIRLWAINFVPQNWLPCEGQTLNITDYAALFALIGITYGGDGTTSFMLPDLRGRSVVGYGSAYPRGSTGGQESRTMTISQMPEHTHTLVGDDTDAASITGTANFFAKPYETTTALNAPLYSRTSENGTVDLNADTVSTAGSGVAFSTRQPYLALRYCIATQGIFPTRS